MGLSKATIACEQRELQLRSAHFEVLWVATPTHEACELWSTVMSEGSLTSVETRQNLSRVIPPEIADILGHPPVLSTENRQAYDALMTQLVLEWKPQNMIGWMFVHDITDHASGDTINALLAAAGYNFRRLLAWLRLLLLRILIALSLFRPAQIRLKSRSSRPTELGSASGPTVARRPKRCTQGYHTAFASLAPPHPL